METLNLGLISDSSIKLDKLQKVVEGAGYSVESALLASNLAAEIPEVNAWVVCLDMNQDSAIILLERLEDERVPVIYDDVENYSSLDHDERVNRFSRKIEACVKVESKPPSQRQRAKKVWVLAASTGGPEAVTAFLKLMPDSLSNIALIYVQHLDGRMAGSLLQIIGRNTCWQVYDCSQPLRLDERSVYVVSPEYQIDIDDVGNLVPVKTPWSGPYSPSVDQILGKVARKFGKDSGAIIFSGMGDDGAKTSKLIALAGGKVWVQAPKSCAVDSMPREALAKDAVSFIGTPEILAQEFIAFHRNEDNLRRVKKYER